MNSRLRKITREPLVHFLLIGAAIFGLYELRTEPSQPERGDRIVISASDVVQMSRLWEKRWQRSPTVEELDGLIRGSVREEVLYREALALGLDRDDVLIRRLLRQKFEFVTQDLAVTPDPSETELAAYYDANRSRYAAPPRFSFTQVYFNTDRRGAGGEHEARLALASLRSGTADTAMIGDGRMLEPTYRNATAADVAALFGEAFAEAIGTLEIGVWSGPITSGYGLHLVRVDAHASGAQLPLREVRDRVRADWANDRRREANEAIFRQLLARYEVIVEPVGGAAGGVRP